MIRMSRGSPQPIDPVSKRLRKDDDRCILYRQTLQIGKSAGDLSIARQPYEKSAGGVVSDSIWCFGSEANRGGRMICFYDFESIFTRRQGADSKITLAVRLHVADSLTVADAEDAHHS